MMRRVILISLSLVLFTSAFSGLSATNSIVPGQNVLGRIEAVGQTNYYEFLGVSNQIITAFLSESNVTAGYPMIELYDPDGNQIGSEAGNVYAGATLLERRLPQDGMYQLRIHDDGGNELFDYGLTLLQGPGSNLGEQPILQGENVSGAISSTAEINVWTFAATSNQMISAFLSQANPTAGQLVLELYAPDGSFIDFAAGNVGAFATFLERRVTQTGTFQLRVRDDGGDELFGYGLTLLQAPDSNLGERAVQPGETVSGSISATAAIETWTFTGLSNQVISAFVAQANPVASLPAVELYDPSGDRIASEAGNVYFGATLLERRVIETGTYQLRVHDDGGNEFFDYSLTFVAIPGDNPVDESGGILTPGLAATNTFVVADLDVFKFPVVAGDSIWLSLRKVGEDPGANPFMDLFAPDGIRLGSGTAISRRCLTKTGDYFVIVRDDGGNETYSYALALVQSPLPAPVWDFDHPYLSIFHCGGRAVVRWPVAIAPFDLEFTPDLSSSTWITINPPFFQSAGYYYHTNSSTDPARFYRLHRR